MNNNYINRFQRDDNYVFVPDRCGDEEAVVASHSSGFASQNEQKKQLNKKTMLLKQIDENTRIVYGFSFWKLGKTFRLERKGKWGWREVAWTYGTCIYTTPKEIEKYLFWYEEKERKVKPKSAWEDYGNEQKTLK